MIDAHVHLEKGDYSVQWNAFSHLKQRWDKNDYDMDELYEKKK